MVTGDRGSWLIGVAVDRFHCILQCIFINSKQLLSGLLISLRAIARIFVGATEFENVGHNEMLYAKFGNLKLF